MCLYRIHGYKCACTGYLHTQLELYPIPGYTSVPVPDTWRYKCDCTEYLDTGVTVPQCTVPDTWIHIAQVCRYRIPGYTSGTALNIWTTAYNNNSILNIRKDIRPFLFSGFRPDIRLVKSGISRQPDIKRPNAMLWSRLNNYTGLGFVTMDER